MRRGNRPGASKGWLGLESSQLRIAILAGIAIAVFSFFASLTMFSATTAPNSAAPQKRYVVFVESEAPGDHAPAATSAKTSQIATTKSPPKRSADLRRPAAKTLHSDRQVRPRYVVDATPPTGLDPRAVILPDFLTDIEGGLITSKLANRADLDHESCTAALKIFGKKFGYHRKTWEFCTIYHVADGLDLLREGASAVGFAVGREPLPSAFAARGVNVMLSDMPTDNDKASSWSKTAQHAASLEVAHKPRILSLEDFTRRARFMPVDMNSIPAELQNSTYDFAWSSSSLEHVGSCKRAIRFFKRSLRAVKPDGYVIHTTEVALSSLSRSWDIPGLCIFTKPMLETLIQDLTAEGHTVLPMRWGVGKDSKYDFDLPPYYQDPKRDHMALWDRHAGLVHTSVLLVVRKASNASLSTAATNGGAAELTAAQRAWIQSRVPLEMALVPTKFRLPPPTVALEDLTIDSSFLAAATDDGTTMLTPAPRDKPVSRLCNRWDFDDGYCWALFPKMDEIKAKFAHRKQWEFCEMVSALNVTGVIRNGTRGLGFAVGQEPLASFFVSKGVSVVVSDMPQTNQEAKGWNGTAQHAAALEATWRKKVVGWSEYKDNARFVPVDMNHIPDELVTGSFDFTWSSSSLEHVGTCEKGLAYFLNSMRTLKPGGIALHTTELTVSSYDHFLDAPHLCFFSRGMMDGITSVLRFHGHEVLGPDGRVDMRLGVRNGVDFDRPPFGSREHMALQDLGVVHTSILFVVRKNPRASRNASDDETVLLPPKHSTTNPAKHVPALHLGHRPFVTESMLAHSDDMALAECRAGLRAAHEPIDFRHRRHWEICAVLHTLRSRDLVGKGHIGVGLDAAQEALAMTFASNLTDVLITYPVNATGYRTHGFNMSRKQYDSRVREVETGHRVPPVIELNDVNERRADFVWSLAMASASRCSVALDTVWRNLAILKPGGIGAFVFTVSLGGMGYDNDQMCAMPFYALLQFAADLRRRGYHVSDPRPEVAAAQDAAEFDIKPFSAMDHMVFELDGQLLTSGLLIITAPSQSNPNLNAADS